MKVFSLSVQRTLCGMCDAGSILKFQGWLQASATEHWPLIIDSGFLTTATDYWFPPILNKISFSSFDRES
jgi:hypothetical protein